MAITRTDSTTTTAATTESGFVDAYLKSVQTEAANKVTRDEDTGAIYLGQYQIDAAMWKTWAAAAGYPGARWDDPGVASKVAGWVANTLYSEFENWGLVAIGWRYGPAAARQVRDAYGGTPAGDILQKMLGKGGATFVDRVLRTMSAALPTTETPPPGFPPGYGGSPGGQIDLEFIPEEGPEPEPFRPRGANPAHLALINVLGQMADRTAGGKRTAVEQIEIAKVSDKAAPVEAVSESDTEYLYQQKGSIL